MARKLLNDEDQSETIQMLQSLSQQDAALLIDRPSKWLRDNPNIGCRNADRTYDGFALVATVLKQERKSECSDPELRRRRNEAEVMKIEAEARQAELKLEESLGNFISRDEVERLIDVLVESYWDTVGQVPKQLSTHGLADLANKVIPTLEKDINSAMVGLSETLRHRLLPNLGEE